MVGIHGIFWGETLIKLNPGSFCSGLKWLDTTRNTRFIMNCSQDRPIRWLQFKVQFFVLGFMHVQNRVSAFNYLKIIWVPYGPIFNTILLRILPISSKLHHTFQTLFFLPAIMAELEAGNIFHRKEIKGTAPNFLLSETTPYEPPVPLRLFCRAPVCGAYFICARM